MTNGIRFLICVLILTASAGLAAGTNDAPGQPMAWLGSSTNGKHFVYEGTTNRFVAWGFNYDRDDAGRLLEDYWADDWTKVAADFREMKSLGANVVRIHLQLCRFMKSPEQPDEENLARLGNLVRLAEQTGVYLDMTGLGCYRKQDVPAWYDSMDESDRWKVEARFWSAVAGVCKASPAIFCYDLMNEPVASGGPNDNWLAGKPLDGKYYVQRLTLDMQGQTESDIAKEWITEMCTAIRAIDKRHMLTVGLVPWEQIFGPGAKSAFRDPDVSAALDFLCVHYYPRDGKLDDDLAIFKLYNIGKPLVMEEIYPLRSSAGTTEEFIRESRQYADGWISFYWGKTPGEYDKDAQVSTSWDGIDDKQAGLKAAGAGNWLRHFSALRGEMMGGSASGR